MKPNKNEIKVLQFGGGNFLRGFADWMIHKCNQQIDYQGDVCVVQTTATVDLFEKQKGIFHVRQCGLQDDEFKSEIEKIAVVQKSLLIHDNFSEYLELASLTTIELVISNTTEKGIYFMDEPFSLQIPSQTFPGKLTQFLYQRFLKEINLPLIVLPCELIDKNGAILKKCVLLYAQIWQLPESFTTWLHTYVTFCNTLVDRIVTGRATQIKIENSRIEDKLYIETEWFYFWAIEGPEWLKERLPFQKAKLNVVYTKDLTPYRERKIKLLNGTHTALAAAAYLANIETVKEAVEHVILGKFIRRLVYDEILLTIVSQDRMVLEKYIEEVFMRFKNPAIRHDVILITSSSFTKFNTRLVPVIQKFYELKGYVPHRLSFALAAIIFLYRGLKAGKEIPLNDSGETIQTLKLLWQEASLSLPGLQALVKKLIEEIKDLQSLQNIHNLSEITGKHLYHIDQFGIVDALKELQDQEHFLFG